MAERGEGEWRVDEAGNLSAPGELKPDTDEFGRDDPDTLERERRRREREQQRAGKPKKQPKRPKRAKQVRQPKEPRPPRAGNFRRRRVLALGLVLVGLLAAWFMIALFQPFAGDGEGHGSVTVEIPEGSSAGDIAELLADQGVVSNARFFEWRLKLAGKSDEVQADTYTLAEDMSYGTAIDRLTGEQVAGDLTVTIPEGLDRTQIAADILPEGVSSDQYLQLTETAQKGFNPAEYGAKSQSLEGFLFPATYDLTGIPEDQNVQNLIQQQLQAFKDNIAKVDMSYAQKKNLTPYDVLIIASMIDKEVQVPEERPIVASVIYNRLNQGIPLGIDATTRFETQNYTEQLTNDVLRSDTPYNTRTNQGLTPTPIGNPGLAALEAAARPADTKFTFFVVIPGTCGEHFFTADENEFKAKAAEYNQALEEQGGSPTEC
ncbi:MAG: endolytic transglycosylase MltG [Dehalococcoidia bacterium]